MLNVGVKALLSWVNSIKSSPGDLRVEDLQDGEILLDVVYKLKKETKPSFNTIEERFKVITQFVEKDCRFRPSEDTSLSWDKIRHGSNLTEEMAKVLLLLVYHDMMNHRCTLSSLECDVEAELAKLTGSYVMEMDGCVYFNSGLDAYLAKKCLPVSREILQPSASTSNSNSTSVSSLSDGDSPVFHRAAKVKFLDIHTVASSSTSKSPLQDIMNTPKFQLRKMKRQMIKEREYIDGLEGELAVKIALIAQKGATLFFVGVGKKGFTRLKQDLMIKYFISPQEELTSKVQLPGVVEGGRSERLSLKCPGGMFPEQPSSVVSSVEAI